MRPLYTRAGFRFFTYFILLLLLTQSTVVAGQDLPDHHKLDSVLSRLRKSKPDSNQVRLLNEFALDFLAKNETGTAAFTSIVKHLKYAVALCDSLHLDFVKWKAKSLQLLGNALIRCGKIPDGKLALMELVRNAQMAGDKKREAESWIIYGDAFSISYLSKPCEHDIETGYVNAINIYRTINDRRSEIDVNLSLAGVYHYNAKFNRCEEQLLPVIKTSEASGAYKLATIYLYLSATNRYSGNYNKALGYSLHAVKAFEDSEDTNHLGSYYGELAEVYQALDKPVESVKWYRKCIEHREIQVEHSTYTLYSLYRTYSLLIGQLIKSGEQKEALATLKDLKRRRPPNSLGQSAVFYQCMAYCYDAENIYDSTEKYYLKALESFSKAGETSKGEIALLSYYDIADFYIRNLQFKNARSYLDEIVQNSSSINVSKLADVHLLLFKVDSASGNYQAAIKHVLQYKVLSDSVFNETKSRQIEQLQIEYETGKKDQEIKLLTKKDQLQQANLRQANIIRNWVVASAVLLVILLALVVSRYRLKLKSNAKLEAQQIVINQKNSSLQRLVNEKEWLIKEIHHRVKNNFHIVMGLLGTQSGYLKNEEAITAIKESQQRIFAMSLIHQKLYQSDNLSSIDMPGYIYELVDSLKESFDKNLSIQFQLQIDRISLELSHVIPVGLILNEAITNAFRHAFPDKKEGNIYISFTHSSADNSIVLTVKDDGIGFSAASAGNGQPTMGISLMKGLCGDIDGNFSIQSTNGTTVSVSFIYKADQIKSFGHAAIN